MAVSFGTLSKDCSTSFGKVFPNWLQTVWKLWPVFDVTKSIIDGSQKNKFRKKQFPVGTTCRQTLSTLWTYFDYKLSSSGVRVLVVIINCQGRGYIPMCGNCGVKFNFNNIGLLFVVWCGFCSMSIMPFIHFKGHCCDHKLLPTHSSFNFSWVRNLFSVCLFGAWVSCSQLHMYYCTTALQSSVTAVTEAAALWPCSALWHWTE